MSRRDRLIHVLAIAVAAVSCTAALLVHSLFVNSLLLPFLMEPLWILWALPAAALRGEGRAP